MLNRTEFDTALIVGPNPIQLADYILTIEHFKSLKDNLFCWNGTYYEPGVEYILNAYIERLVRAFNDHLRPIVHTDGTQTMPKPIKYSSNFAAEITKIICNRTQVTTLDRYATIIPFQNGWYNTTTHLLEMPDVTKFITYSFPYNYTTDTSCPRFVQFMAEIIPNEAHRLKLLKFSAYCFTSRINLQKALILYGRGKNGKSVYVDIMKHIFNGIHSSIPLQNLGDRFNQILYMGKLLNIYDDLGNNSLNDSGYIKNAITADILSGERKGKDPMNYINTCKFIFTTNEIPTPNFSVTEGFYRRWLIIPFLQEFGGTVADLYLLDKLKLETEGIISYILTFLPSCDELRLEDTASVKRDWYRYGNSILSFFEDKCEMGDGVYVPCSELYNKYSDYCRDNDLSLQSWKYFGSIMQKLGVSKRQTKIAESLTPVWVYMNIFTLERRT